jgi:nitrogenase molybdenum-iron protein alpha/beta subunit
LKNWPTNLSRTEGCTLTGALSVSTSIADGLTIIHGPDGCVHHNTSLLHALWHENEVGLFPRIYSSSMTETDVVFGGEERLGETLHFAQRLRPGIICILTSCVAAAIGDDVSSVCDRAGVRAAVIPTGGFLGGGFSRGVSEALLALSTLGEKREENGAVNLIGEKNLEYEAEANFEEVSRLLALLGVRVQLRFVRNIPAHAIASLGSASLNILRDPSLADVGRALEARFGTPYLSSFPVGFGETLAFLRDIGEVLGTESSGAIDCEEKYQKKLAAAFTDLDGSAVTLDHEPSTNHALLDELVEEFGFVFTDQGIPVRLPDPLPVGTAGLSRLLHRWRRSCRA